jgi:transcriptional regulator GlxA family with amidase domain
VLEQVQAAAERGARLVSYCTGAFPLAESRVLDGRRATVHWRLASQFARTFPRVRLERNLLFLQDGNITTSAGTTAAIDLLLHMVREDHGAEVARYLGRRIVASAYRRGADVQHLDQHAEPRVRADDLVDVLDWAHLNLQRPIGVADLAQQACMSERSFARRFKEALGTTPHRWLVAERLRRAQELLEVSDLTVDVVAAQSGFGTAANLRMHFNRELGTAPAAYRRAHAAAT